MTGAQDRDTFEYWDIAGNGVLTCGEALWVGSFDGFKLPIHHDDGDGAALIYEWLERGTGSDSG